MNNRGRNSNILIKLAAVFFMLVGLITIARMQLRYNELVGQKKELEAELAARAATVETLKKQIDAPFDDDYVIEIARKKLNLCLPEEIIFYNDLTD